MNPHAKISFHLYSTLYNSNDVRHLRRSGSDVRCLPIFWEDLFSAAVHLYLHSIAEVSPSSRSHHGQQACPRSDVQDDDLLATGLHSGHSCSDALIVFFILTTTTTKHENVFPKYSYYYFYSCKYFENIVTLVFPNTHPVMVMKHVCIGRPGKRNLINH